MQERSLPALSKFSWFPSATEMQIGKSGSGCYWKRTVLARSTVVLITDPQKRKMLLYSVTIYCCFFNLTAVATEAQWNTRTLPALVRITEDFPWFLIPDFPGVGKSHRDLQVSRPLSCPSGSAASQLQVWQLYKGYEQSSNYAQENTFHF